LTLAQQYFDTRIAEPKLSVLARATALQWAFDTFDDMAQPERFRIAQRYLREMDALPDGDDAVLHMDLWAHFLVANQYMAAGQDSAGLAHSEFVLRALPRLRSLDPRQELLMYTFPTWATMIGGRLGRRIGSTRRLWLCFLSSHRRPRSSRKIPP